MYREKLISAMMLDDDAFKEQINDFIIKQDWLAVSDLLENKFKIIPEQNTSSIPSEAIVSTLADLLNKLTILVCDRTDDGLVNVTKETFRSLRNLVAFNRTCSQYVLDNKDFLLDTYQLLEFMKYKEKYIECTKVLLQFLINLVVNNSATTQTVWEIFHKTVESFINDVNYSYYGSALAYNLLHNDDKLVIESAELFKTVFHMYKKDNKIEYLTFLLEIFIGNRTLNKTYIDFMTEDRIIFLEVLKQELKSNKEILSADFICILSNEFKQKSDCILKVVTDYLEQIEPYEVTLLLEVLATISCDENYLNQLQNDKSLLINCIFLLKSIHSLGQQSENVFTAVQKLAEHDPEKYVDSPVFGFKAGLIRILGNLAWKSKINQDEMRELGCIPLLLDCCNIDATNPFIMQWSIFAIRNLCDDNVENQKVIAQMNRRGFVSSDTLQEMGMTLHSEDGNQIRIVPLNK